MSRFMSGAQAATLWPDREDELYRPSFPGVHLCGANHEDNYFYTIGDFPTASDDEAKALWLALRAECEVDREAADFLVDYNTKEGYEDDFWTNSQMLARIEAIATQRDRPTNPTPQSDERIGE